MRGWGLQKLPKKGLMSDFLWTLGGLAKRVNKQKGRNVSIVHCFKYKADTAMLKLILAKLIISVPISVSMSLSFPDYYPCSVMRVWTVLPTMNIVLTTLLWSLSSMWVNSNWFYIYIYIYIYIYLSICVWKFVYKCVYVRWWMMRSYYT